MTAIAVCCGVGGVGKTTLSAALALAQALQGRRVIVLTIDPARRLADALGVPQLGNTPTPIDLRPLEAAGDIGTLDAVMLDRARTFDELVERFAPSREQAARLLANPYYDAARTRLSGAHEYLAIEKLYQLVEADRWDLIVLDTPPSQHAVDFLRAPDRMRKLFDGSVYTALTNPGGGGLLGGAARRALGLITRIAGESMLADATEFFKLLSGVAVALEERGRAVARVLHTDACRFFLVTPPRASEAEDVSGFVRDLARERLKLDALIVNRVVERPAFVLGPDDLIAPDGWTEARFAPWRAAIGALPTEADDEHARHRAAIEHLVAATGRATPVWQVPEVPGGVRTLHGLAALAPHLMIG